MAAGAGAIVAALLASACCVGPLVLALLGLGGAGLLVRFEPYRPLFVAITVALLGAGFYAAYRPRRAAAPAGGDASDCGCPAPRANRAGRALLWVAAVLVAVLLAFPYLAPLLAR
ncbi:MAG: mercuric transport protein [Deltaproteobacteria bacterium]|nr:MAG: mercuric transport protein [Deltaproteobacteria bacterium]